MKIFFACFPSVKKLYIFKKKLKIVNLISQEYKRKHKQGIYPEKEVINVLSKSWTYYVCIGSGSHAKEIHFFSGTPIDAGLLS